MIDVIWWDAAFGNFDHGLLASIFDANKNYFTQHNTKEIAPVKKAIVIVSGKPEIKPLRQYLDSLDDGLVILCSEEDGYFDWKSAVPEHLEIWTQYYTPSTKSEIKTRFRLLLGAPNRIKNYKTKPNPNKKYLWSFVGQTQNPSRHKCVEVLKTMPDGYLHITSAFGGYSDDGMEYQQYLDVIRDSKYVFCPSGSMCVDSFRLYEAIECGAIPITEKRSPRDNHDFDYWKSIDPQHSVITVNDWAELPSMIKLLEGNSWIGESANIWWTQYKEDIENLLIEKAF